MPSRTTLNKYFVLILILFLFFLLSDFALACTTDAECAPAKCIDEKCVRALEIVYPKIPGVVTPETVAIGLPEYVNYIFQFVVIIIGFIIFGVLIYNGVIYLTSAGDPSKMTDARAGIFAGFLGAIILLSAYLIFHTINPQLVYLEVEEVDPLRPMILPGIYVCDYKVTGDINGYLDKYKTGNQEEQIEAAKEIKKIMTTEKGESCRRMEFSGNFQNFVVEKNDTTFFSIPGRRIEGKYYIYDVYEYGLILHEKDNHRGKCKLVTTDPPYKEQIARYPDFDFEEARSFTIFKKIPEEALPSPDAKGVILYQCVNYNEGGSSVCPKDVTIPAAVETFNIIDTIRTVSESELGDLAGDLNDIKKGARSIQIDPKGSFFAILFGELGGLFADTTSEICEVVKSNDNNLLDQPMGRCGQKCSIEVVESETQQMQLYQCFPCLKSMIVIKGQAL